MKLSWINESLMGIQIRNALSSSNFFNRPMVQTDQPFEATTGNSNPNGEEAPVTNTGIPKKQRHRSYLGLEMRPGTIRL